MESSPSISPESLETRKPVCRRFEEVQTFSDLAEVVFGLSSTSVNSGWNPDKPGEPEKGRYDDKCEWLLSMKKYHLDEWWVYDDSGVGHNMGKLTRRINPKWQEGIDWTDYLTPSEKESIIRTAWERALDNKTTRWAEKLGGKMIKLSQPSMEAGISSVVVIDSKPQPENQLLFRGVRVQHEYALNQQVCGMLRTGEDEMGRTAMGTIYVERWSTVIDDEDVVDAVHTLATQPTEEAFLELINIYNQKGFSALSEQAATALRWTKELVTNQNMLFGDALAEVHWDLMVGVIGVSPFISTAHEMGMTSGFVGMNGMVIVSSVDRSQISPLPTRGNEKLVVGGIKRDDVVAFVPVNRQWIERSDSLAEEMREAFAVAGKEIASALSTTSS